MAKLILGLAGEMGCGKGTVANYLVEKYNGSSHSFSTALKDILDRLYLDRSRDNLNGLSKALRGAFGEDVFAKSMSADAENDPHDVVVVENARRLDDIYYLRLLPHFKFVYIDAGMENRYKRMVERNQYVGDDMKTFEEFKREHELNTEASIPPLKEHANYVITNNGSLEDLYSQIDGIIKQNIG